MVNIELNVGACEIISIVSIVSSNSPYCSLFSIMNRISSDTFAIFNIDVISAFAL